MTKLFALPCKKIRDSLGFWIPRRGFRIQGNGSKVLCQWNLDSGFPSLVGFQSPWAVYLWIPNPRILDISTSKFSRILDSTKKNLLDSGIWIPYIGQCYASITYYSFSQTVFWWIEMNHAYVWIINVCMRLWENLTNFYLCFSISLKFLGFFGKPT